MEKISREQIDDYKRRNQAPDSYKYRRFGDRKSARDEYTGARIFLDSQKHSAGDKRMNVDHITPIDVLRERYKDDITAGRLTVGDLREMANHDANLALTNAHINQSKSNRTNAEYLFDKALSGEPEGAVTTYNMLEKQAVSEAYIRTNAAVKKTGHILEKVDCSVVKSAGKRFGEFSEAAGDAAGVGIQSGIFAATVSGIQNFVQAGRGEKSIDEAVKDTATSGASSTPITSRSRR